jgi:histone-lysine N-methyltransferase ASH1L
MDLATFCKGRPKGALEEDVYICEYRVDKKARLFDKIPKSSSKSNSKNKFPAICTKWFAFDSFDIKLKPVRSYTPHEVPEKWKPPIKNQGKDLPSSSSDSQKKQISLLRIRRREKLDTTLTRLLSQLPNANDPWDASFLLKRNKKGNKNKKAN